MRTTRQKLKIFWKKKYEFAYYVISGSGGLVLHLLGYKVFEKFN